jgi:hypothetical protein
MGGGGERKYSMKVMDIAEACYEVNRVWCRVRGDTSQPSWDDAPEWQKNSTASGVAAHLLNPDLTPEQSHNLWMAQKHADGWVYGPAKDPDRKEHPCMLPHSELPPEQRAKDLLFARTIKMFLEAEKLT